MSSPRRAAGDVATALAKHSVTRREFVGTMFALLCAARDALAQAGPVRRIGWIDLNPSADSLGYFKRSMAAKGWVEGSNLAVESRGGDGRAARLAAMTAELVRLPVDVLVCVGTLEALAARDSTRSVPIVLAGVDDPVGQKLVASLARPGRNITGVASGQRQLRAKLISVIRELGPAASRTTLLWDSAEPEHRAAVIDFRSAAKAAHLTLNAVEVQGYMDVEPAIVASKRPGNKVLLVLPSRMFVPRWIVDLALSNGLALASTSSGYIDEGGLVACTDDWNAMFDRVATYVDRILKGAKPADLPVEFPAKFRLIVNKKTARALKLTLPPSLLGQADAVIE